MHHRAVMKLGRHDNLPVNIQCSCGTGGDFGSAEEAAGWMQRNHFRFLQGINTAEFVDETPKLEPLPEPPAPEQSEESKEEGPQ